MEHNGVVLVLQLLTSQGESPQPMMFTFQRTICITTKHKHNVVGLWWQFSVEEC